MADLSHLCAQLHRARHGFRANFFASIATLIGWLFYYVALIKIIFLNTDSIAGWSEGETLILSGSLTIVWATLNAFFYDNLSELPQMIRRERSIWWSQAGG